MRIVNIVFIICLGFAGALNAQASPFRIQYSKLIQESQKTEFEKHLSQAYQYVSTRFEDSVDRTQCPIEIRFRALGGRSGFTPKPNGACNDIIELDFSLEGDWTASVSVVHELVHIIRNQKNLNEAVWLNEGIAKYLEVNYIDLWPQEFMRKIQSKNIFSLNLSHDDFFPLSDAYGQAFIFVHYLASRLGGLHLLAQIMKSEKSGWSAIEEAALVATKAQNIVVAPERLNRIDLWTHFAFALKLNDPYMAINGLLFIDSRWEKMTSATVTAKAPFVVDQFSVGFYKRLLPAQTQKALSSNARVYLIDRNSAGDIEIKSVKVDTVLPVIGTNDEFVVIGLPL